MSQIEKDLMVNKKPYFQKYVYPKLGLEYFNFVKARDDYSLLNYNIDWKHNNDEEFIKYMDWKNPVLDNDSVMNKICHYLESEIHEIKRNYKNQDINIINNILLDNSRKIRKSNVLFFEKLLNEYKSLIREENNKNTKRNNSDSYDKQKRFNLINKEIREKAYEYIGNSIDIANLAVSVGYQGKTEESKDFVWNIFGKEVFENVKNNQNKRIYIPIQCQKEDYEFMYLGDYYKRKEWKETNVNI